jgi:hypothetical protein
MLINVVNKGPTLPMAGVLSTAPSGMADENSINPLEIIKQGFLKSVHTYPEYPCGFCRRLQYFKSTRSFTLNQSILTKIQNIYSCELPFILNEVIRVCFRCYDNASKETFSAQVFFNNMKTSEIPEPIKQR